MSCDRWQWRSPDVRVMGATCARRAGFALPLCPCIQPALRRSSFCLLNWSCVQPWLIKRAFLFCATWAEPSEDGGTAGATGSLQRLAYY